MGVGNIIFHQYANILNYVSYGILYYKRIRNDGYIMRSEDDLLLPRRRKDKEIFMKGSQKRINNK